MKTYVILFAFFILSLDVSSQKSYKTGKLIENQLFSKNLINKVNEVNTRNVLVYIPPSYGIESSKYYPTLYLLHSYGETLESWKDSPNTQRLHIQKTMDSLISIGKISEMIVVMPDCSNRFGGSWYTNSSTLGFWETFISIDLVEYIDKNFRTIANSTSRGIAGHSMGGYGALKIAMKNPDVFGSVYAMSSANLASDKLSIMKYGELLKKLNNKSPLRDYTLFEKLILSKALAFVPNDVPPYYSDYLYSVKNDTIVRDESVWNRWSSHLLINQIDDYKTKNLTLTIAFDHGSEDFLINESRDFSRQLHNKGIGHIFSEYSGDHTNKFRVRFETYMLPFFSNNLEK